MLTFSRKPILKLLNSHRMFDNSLYISAAVAACGIGVGWLLRGLMRSNSTSTPTSTEFEVGTVGTGDACKLVIVVRNDLKMGKGKIAAQCCHAAVMAYEQMYKKHPQLLQEWRYHGQPKVVVRVDSEQQLLDVASKARSSGLVVSLVQDAGRTQIAPGSKTVVGIGPGPKDLIDAVTGELKLM